MNTELKKMNAEELALVNGGDENGFITAIKFLINGIRQTPEGKVTAELVNEGYDLYHGLPGFIKKITS